MASSSALDACTEMATIRCQRTTTKCLVSSPHPSALPAHHTQVPCQFATTKCLARPPHPSALPADCAQVPCQLTTPKCFASSPHKSAWPAHHTQVPCQLTTPKCLATHCTQVPCQLTTTRCVRTYARVHFLLHCCAPRNCTLANVGKATLATPPQIKPTTPCNAVHSNASLLCSLQGHGDNFNFDQAGDNVLQVSTVTIAVPLDLLLVDETPSNTHFECL